MTNGLDTLTDTHRASQAAEQVLATLAQIRPAGGGATSQTLLREEQMLSRIARQFHLPEEKLRSRLTALRREATRQTSRGRSRRRDRRIERQQRSPATRLADLPAWDRDLLELVLLDPVVRRADRSESIEPEPIHVGRRPADLRRLLPACARQGRRDDFGRLLAEFDEPEHEEPAGRNSTNRARRKRTADRERWLADLLETHRRRGEEVERRSRPGRRPARATDDAEQLLAQFCEQSQAEASQRLRKEKEVRMLLAVSLLVSEIRRDSMRLPANSGLANSWTADLQPPAGCSLLTDGQGACAGHSPPQTSRT